MRVVVRLIVESAGVTDVSGPYTLSMVGPEGLEPPTKRL